jgi:hypothetical protein
MSTNRLQSLYDENGRLPRFTDLGGYPLYYLSSNGGTWCPDCANQEDAEPEIVDADVNWEDSELYCDGCPARIPSAYAEEDQ